MLETADSAEPRIITEQQLLLHFVHDIGGCMTRVLDFWFGVDSDLRLEYSRIYAESRRFARLPPTDDGHDETYCLKVSVCNRHTDYHEGASDLVHGLTGLVQSGVFEGAEMCIDHWIWESNITRSMLYRGLRKSPRTLEMATTTTMKIQMVVMPQAKCKTNLKFQKMQRWQR